MLLLSVTQSWSQFVGEVALITIAATMLGLAAQRFLPVSMGPSTWAFLLPMLLLGGLAYIGVGAAAVALILFFCVAVTALALGIA
jgi:hypothetical protein